MQSDTRCEPIAIFAIYYYLHGATDCQELGKHLLLSQRLSHAINEQLQVSTLPYFIWFNKLLQKLLNFEYTLKPKMHTIEGVPKNIHFWEL